MLCRLFVYLCITISAKKCSRCMVPRDHFYEPACRFKARDPQVLVDFWKHGQPDLADYRAFSAAELATTFGK